MTQPSVEPVKGGVAMNPSGSSMVEVCIRRFIVAL